MRKRRKTYFHASRKHMKPGDIIYPQNNPMPAGIWVSLDPAPHYTLYQFGDRSCNKQKHRMYEVRPLNPKTKIVFGTWDELIIIGPVIITRNLGDVALSGNTSSVEKRWRGLGRGQKMYVRRYNRVGYKFIRAFTRDK